MKNKKIFMVCFSILNLVAPSTVFSSITLAQNSAPTSQPVTAAPSFESTRDWNKLTPTFQTQYSAAKTSGNMSQRVDCFVRVEPPADSGDRTFLESKGFVFITFAGPIARGYMPMSAVEDVAKLPFVQNVNCHP